MKNLKQRRLKAKLTQIMLAKKMKLARRTVQYHEENGVPVSRVRAYMEVLSAFV